MSWIDIGSQLWGQLQQLPLDFFDDERLDSIAVKRDWIGLHSNLVVVSHDWINSCYINPRNSTGKMHEDKVTNLAVTLGGIKYMTKVMRYLDF